MGDLGSKCGSWEAARSHRILGEKLDKEKHFINSQDRHNTAFKYILHFVWFGGHTHLCSECTPNSVHREHP